MSKASAVRKTDVPAAESGGDGPSGGGKATVGDVRQFVIFHVKDEMFAVPLAEVREIIRMPEVVRMPLSPRALEGLANLRGAVLPVINLRSIFNFEQLDHDDATRVVVLDQGRPIGLVVDRMANVVSVEADCIEEAGSIQSTVDTTLLTGMIKGQDGASMVMILDAAGVVQREFQDVGARSADRAAAAAVERAADEAYASVADGRIDETQLVSF